MEVTAEGAPSDDRVHPNQLANDGLAWPERLQHVAPATAAKQRPALSRERISSGWGEWGGIPVLGALTMVLGLFFLTAWCLKRATPAAQRRLPVDVIQVLGHFKLSESQVLRLLRVGNKLLLVSFADNRAETLTEITEPEQVQQLLRQCHGGDTAAVSEWLSNLEQGECEVRSAA